MSLQDKGIVLVADELH